MSDRATPPPDAALAPSSSGRPAAMDPELTVAPPPAPPDSSPVRRIFFGPDGLRAGWGLLLFLLLFSILSQVAQALLFAFGPHTGRASGAAAEQSPLRMIVSELLFFAATAAATRALAQVERRPIGRFGLGARPRAPRQFLAGALFGLLFLSILAGLLWATHFLVFDGRLLSGSAALTYGAVWLLGFLAVGLFEEYLVRGYLQFTLTRGIDGLLSLLVPAQSPAGRKATAFWISAIALSFVFGLGHHSNPGESPLGLLTAGLAGLLFCLALWRSGSLWWAVGFHTTWDWAQSFLFGVPDSGTMVSFHLLRSHPVGQPVLSGGLTGPEGSVFALPVMAAAGLVILFTLRGAPASEPVHRTSATGEAA